MAGRVDSLIGVDGGLSPGYCENRPSALGGFD